MGLTWILYLLGVVCAAACLFLCPFPWLGFAPLAVGCVWAAYDLAPVKEPDGNTSTAPTRARLPYDG